MAAKLLTMLMATFIVRFITTPNEFMLGLRQLGMPKDFSLILDNILSTLEKTPRKNKNKTDKQNMKNQISVMSVLKGDFASVTELINCKLDESRKKFANNDIAIIAAFSMIITMIRFIKIVPGLPIAPGHKNVLIIPFFILGAKLSTKRFSATHIGFLSGIIHFISGFGKYGPLGILQFALLGFVIDIMMLLFKNTNSLVFFGFTGLVAGLLRVFSEIFLAWLLNMPVEYYLFYLPFIILQGLFGLSSAIVTTYLVKEIN